DAGSDAVPDAGTDAVPDAGTDAVPDAGSDAVPDAGADAVPDAGSDAVPDAGSDAVPDAGSDAVPDAGPFPIDNNRAREGLRKRRAAPHDSARTQQSRATIRFADGLFRSRTIRGIGAETNARPFLDKLGTARDLFCGQPFNSTSLRHRE